MTLETLIGKDTLKSLRGRPFGIDPKIVYNSNSEEIRAEFVGKAGDLFDIEEYYATLRENSGDIGTINDLVGIAVNYMPGDKGENAAMLRDPHVALEQADVLLSAGYYNMARFVENNRDAIFDRLSADQLYGLFSKVPLYKTGNQEHDNIADLRAKMMQIQEASKKGEDLGSAIQKELQELIGMIPEEQRAFLQNNSRAMISSLTNAVVNGVQKSFKGLFRQQDKTLDKNALREYLEDNYEVVEDTLDDKNKSSSERLSEREKFGRWDKNLKMQYVEVARALFKSEKPIHKKEKDEDKKAREDRDKNKGMRT